MNVNIKNMIKKIIIYKEKNFDSWLEFIITLGISGFNDGGYLIAIYFWGGGFAMLGMWLMLKYGI